MKILLSFFFLLLSTIPNWGLTVDNLKVNSCTRALIDAAPTFSWQLHSEKRGVFQYSYKINIYADPQVQNLLWSTGDIISEDNVHVTLKNIEYQPDNIYYWLVEVKDNYGDIAKSNVSYFFTGHMNLGWEGARWIKSSVQEAEKGVQLFRKKISIDKPIVRALLYTSALGVYDVKVNDNRVGHLLDSGNVEYEEMKPGWTDYNDRVSYSCYNITSFLNHGTNIIKAVVSNGWWQGRISEGIYGRQDLAFIAKIVLLYDDDTRELFVTDDTWEATDKGPISQGDIYDGEIYDARITEPEDWYVVDYFDYNGKIVPLTGNSVYGIDCLKRKPISIKVYDTGEGNVFNLIKVYTNKGDITSFVIQKGETAIIDFGQNLVGWPQISMKGYAGTKLKARFSEMLNDDDEGIRGGDGPKGSLYLANLRSAEASLTYFLKGDKDGENYHPVTTFYGFRYCEITADSSLTINGIEAIPISSATEVTGYFACSNSSLNQLFSNILWSQRGNFISIPTDCPQRDERYGWGGDAQVFANTGMYNFNTEEFYLNYMRCMRDSQREDGSYYVISPTIFNTSHYGAAAWADAGIIIPYMLYKMFGNIEAIREHYDSMEKYMNWLAERGNSQYKFQGGYDTYGDWLAYDKCDNRYVSVAYYAYDAMLMSIMSKALSIDGGDRYAMNEERYYNLFRDIKEEFNSRYWNPIPEEHTQTTFLLPLAFDLLDKDNTEIAKTLLLKAIDDNKGLLSTGFWGTSLFLPTLSKMELDSVAYNLLLQRDNPSWLYSIDQGSTTMWERWDSYTIDKGYGPPNMNSFNHYAYGAVGEWLYRYMSGIEADDCNPGFKSFVLQPRLDMRIDLPEGQERITNVNANYICNYGKISSEWHLTENHELIYSCEVPANTTATLILPLINADYPVYEDDKPAELSEGVELLSQNNTAIAYKLSSGKYLFRQKKSTTNIENQQKVLGNNMDIYLRNNILELNNRIVSHVFITDIQGNPVLSITKPSCSLNLSNMKKGVYIIMIEEENGLSVIKYLKTN